MTGWKTAIVSILLAVFGALQGLDWVNLFPNNQTATGWIVSGIGVVMFALRAVTTTPLFTKK